MYYAAKISMKLFKDFNKAYEILEPFTKNAKEKCVPLQRLEKDTKMSLIYHRQSYIDCIKLKIMSLTIEALSLKEDGDKLMTLAKRVVKELDRKIPPQIEVADKFFDISLDNSLVRLLEVLRDKKYPQERATFLMNKIDFNIFKDESTIAAAGAQAEKYAECEGLKNAKLYYETYTKFSKEKYFKKRTDLKEHAGALLQRVFTDLRKDRIVIEDEKAPDPAPYPGGKDTPSKKSGAAAALDEIVKTLENAYKKRKPQGGQQPQQAGQSQMMPALDKESGDNPGNTQASVMVIEKEGN
jgi:hypothetical protein